VLLGTAPDSLDPSVAYSTQAAEALWPTHLPLLTYRHASGSAGTRLIPALAAELPRVSRDGRSYSLRLRPGLRYGGGRRVLARDFLYAIERAIRLNWPGKSFFLGSIVGAAAYDAHEAAGISGIRTEDVSGRITIRLTRAYGPFANVLAFLSAAPLPWGTPMRPSPHSPPAGVGPYRIADIVPGHGFTLRRDPGFAGLRIPGIPTGELDKITFRVVSSNAIEAEEVLRNRADAFDASDSIPPGLLAQIKGRAGDRFAQVALPATFYFFMNTREPPFDRLQARQAVEYAIDRSALRRLASGFLTPTCYLLPSGITGHPTAPCPYGQRPDLAKARRLVAASGTAGTRVTVWGRQTSPFAEFARYYASVLGSIGYRTTLKLLADSVYFQTIGNVGTHAQTGYAEWAQDFPNPIDFYLLVDARSIRPQGNLNFSMVDDPLIQRMLPRLESRPATLLDADAPQWEALDRHTAARAYLAVIGQRSLPKFLSSRIDFASAIFSPVYLNDVSSWRLASGAR